MNLRGTLAPLLLLLFVPLLQVAYACDEAQESLLTDTNSKTCLNASFLASHGIKPATRPATIPHIRMDVRDWSSHQISSAIIAIVLAEATNYPVGIVCNPGCCASERIHDGTTNLHAEYWSDNYPFDVAKYIEEHQSVENVGVTGYSGQSGVFIPSYMQARYPEGYLFFSHSSLVHA